MAEWKSLNFHANFSLPSFSSGEVKVLVVAKKITSKLRRRKVLQEVSLGNNFYRINLSTHQTRLASLENSRKLLRVKYISTAKNFSATKNLHSQTYFHSQICFLAQSFRFTNFSECSRTYRSTQIFTHETILYARFLTREKCPQTKTFTHELITLTFSRSQNF